MVPATDATGTQLTCLWHLTRLEPNPEAGMLDTTGSVLSVAVHPNDEVNRGQSSNDVFPTAMNVATVQAIAERVLPAVQALREALRRARRWFRAPRRLRAFTILVASGVQVAAMVALLLIFAVLGFNFARFHADLPRVERTRAVARSLARLQHRGPDSQGTCEDSAHGLALDLDSVAARRDVDSEPGLDGDQVPVVIAEQRPEQIGLLELELEPGAVGHRGEVAAGHQAARREAGSARIIEPFLFHSGATVTRRRERSRGRRPRARLR